MTKIEKILAQFSLQNIWSAIEDLKERASHFDDRTLQLDDDIREIKDDFASRWELKGTQELVMILQTEVRQLKEQTASLIVAISRILNYAPVVPVVAPIYPETYTTYGSADDQSN